MSGTLRPNNWIRSLRPNGLGLGCVGLGEILRKSELIKGSGLVEQLLVEVEWQQLSEPLEVVSQFS